MELSKREKEILYELAHDHYEELYKGEWNAVKQEVSESISSCTNLLQGKQMELSKEQMEKVIYELECNYNSKIFDDENLIIIINLFKKYLNSGGA